MYGNYDQRNDLPQFDLYLGPSLWDKAILPNAAFGMVREVIHVLQSNYLHICLVNWERHTIHIFLGVEAFEKHYLHRWLNGAPSKTRCLFNKFPQDIYDRAWWPYQETDWTQITTSSKIETGNARFQMFDIMYTCTLLKYKSLKLISPDSREFNNYTNGSYYAGPYSPTNLFVDTLYSPAALDAGQVYLERTANSTLPPIFNAIELNLSSSGLTGGIPPYIQNLSQLQYLDLSNNSLTGPVPEFLSKLQSLTILNLNDNSLNGSVPAELVEKSKNGLTLITNNFQRVLGKGVFGTVFHGCFNDTQVAVKMLSESSAQGYKQFHVEVELLLRVHHRNLTPLIGYCDDGSNPGLVYEFMAKGNLAEHLSSLSARFFTQQELVTFDAIKNKVLLHEYLFVDAGNSSNILTWEQRLRRALEAAQVVAGILGYLDPKYTVSSRLTEKSDVYSFGMVLLEIIKSRPMIDRTSRVEATHIKQWVDFMLSNGASIKRPTKNFVVVELAECLSSTTETMTERGDEDEPRESIEKMTVNFGFDTIPLAR
ncbi:hypothetical protein GOBAR_DD28317 [Gossypium barbadense]|nr:hypothetical protein GOBAR_DD28317 [Gossypium barbadense]